MGTYHYVAEEDRRTAGVTPAVRFTAGGWAEQEERLAVVLTAVRETVERNPGASWFVAPIPAAPGQADRVAVLVRRGTHPMITVGTIDDLRVWHPEVFRD